jgi:mono/diheme cytochrome c family protein
MKQVLVLLIAVSIVLTGAYGVITVYDDNLEVGRMWKTPGIRPHEEPIPIMATGIVPLSGGEAFARTTPDSALTSPINRTLAFDFKQGQKAYNIFCSHCHGLNHDGLGTVGQSFTPLPGDLRSKKVQSMAERTLYKEISFGKPGGRQPPLATTITMEDRWQIITYLKSLGTRP